MLLIHRIVLYLSPALRRALQPRSARNFSVLSPSYPGTSTVPFQPYSWLSVNHELLRFNLVSLLSPAPLSDQFNYFQEPTTEVIWIRWLRSVSISVNPCLAVSVHGHAYALSKIFLASIIYQDQISPPLSIATG